MQLEEIFNKDDVFVLYVNCVPLRWKSENIFEIMEGLAA